MAFFDPAGPEASIAELLAGDPFAGVTDRDFDAFLAPIAPWDISREYSALLTLARECPVVVIARLNDHRALWNERRR